jgi:hypothetical protein
MSAESGPIEIYDGLKRAPLLKWWTKFLEEYISTFNTDIYRTEVFALQPFTITN